MILIGVQKNEDKEEDSKGCTHVSDGNKDSIGNLIRATCLII